MLLLTEAQIFGSFGPLFCRAPQILLSCGVFASFAALHSGIGGLLGSHGMRNHADHKHLVETMTRTAPTQPLVTKKKQK